MNGDGDLVLVGNMRKRETTLAPAIVALIALPLIGLNRRRAEGLPSQAASQFPLLSSCLSWPS